MVSFAGIFGIHNHTVSMVATLLLLFLVVLWLALAYWTFADARRRIDDGMLVGLATVVAILPFAGPLIYMIVRPPEYLEDVHERELEIQAAEARIAQIGYHTCPHCDYEIEKEFVRCPNCLRKLREPCVGCGRPLHPEWRICPYCETDVGLDPTLSRRPRRTRRTPGETSDLI